MSDHLEAESTEAQHDEILADAGEPGFADADSESAAQVASHRASASIAAVIESLLFVADKPVSITQLAQSLKVDAEIVADGLRNLAHTYVSDGRGLRIQEQQGKYRLVTMPEAAGAIEDFLNLDLNTKLSGPALETLAVIAYRQPVTRAQVEAVRGVDCGGVLRSLVQRGLVEEVGRLETVGRPILYSITEQFMHHFGLTNMDELPPLPAPEANLLVAVTELPDEAPSV